jgi:transcriptional regulator with XRE-family HTH domain
MTPFQRWIEAERSAGRSDDEIADELGVTRQAVYYWRMGERRPQSDQLLRIANVTGIELEKLLA